MCKCQINVFFFDFLEIFANDRHQSIALSLSLLKTNQRESFVEDFLLVLSTIDIEQLLKIIVISTKSMRKALFNSLVKYYLSINENKSMN